MTFLTSAATGISATGPECQQLENNRDNIPRPSYHFNYEGYTVGSPVYFPGQFNANKNRLFFLWSEEYQEQLIPEGVHRVTVPTQLE